MIATSTISCNRTGSVPISAARSALGKRAIETQMDRNLVCEPRSGSRLRQGTILGYGRGFRGIEEAVGKQLHAIIHEEPGQGVAPDEQRPAPAERRHEQPVDRDQGRHRLRAQDREQQYPERDV